MSFGGLDGQVKKFDIQGVVFLSGPQPYMWYVEVLIKTYNAVDRTFYNAILYDFAQIQCQTTDFHHHGDPDCHHYW